MYRQFPPALIKWSVIEEKLLSVKWDAHGPSSKPHNEFVDLIELQFKETDAFIKKHHLPPQVVQRIWSESAEFVAECLVSSFSKAKKCSSDGRNSMTNDLKVLKAKLEALFSLQPLPKWDYVSEFVHAYYLGASDLLKWMTENPDYSKDCYFNLLETGACASLSKKERERLSTHVELLIKQQDQNQRTISLRHLELAKELHTKDIQRQQESEIKPEAVSKPVVATASGASVKVSPEQPQQVPSGKPPVPASPEKQPVTALPTKRTSKVSLYQFLIVL